MTKRGAPHADDDAEEERERYRELLSEVRTLLPGAQVLFAFLLTVPFSARFENLDRAGLIVFSVSMLSIAAATLLFLAPTAYHRLSDRRDRRARLRFGVRTTLAGMLLLGLSISAVLFVVVRFLFGGWELALAAAAAVALGAFLLWYVLPVTRRRRSGGRSDTQLD